MFPNPQPAKGVLAMRRIPNRRVARALRFSDHYVSRVLNGYERPSERFRQALAAMLGQPESALFHDETTLGAGR